MHVVPTPMTVVFEHERFHIGDRVYLLTYLGEGWMKVWFKGNIYAENLMFIRSWRPESDDRWPSCVHPSAECWGRIEEREPMDWWVHVKTSRGLTGWTNQVDHFAGKDLCG